MKIFKFMMMALVAMCGLNSCSDDCDHDFIEHDYSQALVGTWTCMDNDYAEALVIKADGSVEVTGVVDHEFFQSKGTIKVVNNKMVYKLDNGDEWEGRFEMIAGESFSMILDDELDIRYTYRYCENDLADEVVGLWVCNDGPSTGKDMTIITYSENGKMSMTAGATSFVGKDLVNVESDYVVVGDLIFKLLPKGNVGEGKPNYIASRLIYTPNGTSLGDILTETSYLVNNDFEVINTTSTFLRIKQNLALAGQKYDYNNLYLSNVKGQDKDIDFMGQTFNFSEMDGVKLDKMLKTLLFSFEFPDANTLKYSCHFSHQAEPAVVEAPIAVDGNKMTIKVSEVYPGLKDVDVYTFQDQDNCQMHMYMPTSSVEAFFGNLQVLTLYYTGQLDKTDAAAVKAVYDRVDAAIESINLTIILK